MNLRNQRPAFLPSFLPYERLPEQPFSGMSVLHTPSGMPFQYDGSAWRCMRPGHVAYPDPGGLLPRRAVTLAGGVPVLTDPAVHARTDAVVRALVDDVLVVICDSGELDGFEDLEADTPLYVGADGVLVHDPDGLPRRLHIGRALTPERILIRIEAHRGDLQLVRLQVEADGQTDFELGAVAVDEDGDPVVASVTALFANGSSYPATTDDWTIDGTTLRWLNPVPLEGGGRLDVMYQPAG